MQQSNHETIFSWNEIYTIWKKEMEKYGISLNNFFTIIETYDPKYKTNREIEYKWCTDIGVEQYEVELQRCLLDHPGVIYLGRYWGSGETITIDVLGDFENDIEKISAILMNASLFPRVCFQ